MAPRPVEELSLNGWAVLTLLVTDGPAHGFALAALLAKRTDLGQVWTVQLVLRCTGLSICWPTSV